MSYSVTLKYKSGRIAKVCSHQDGGTIVIGGSDEAWMAVTYNYHIFFAGVFGDDGLRVLHGKSGAKTVNVLENAVIALGTERDQNYWAKTPGNAGHALNIMLHWAKQRPKAVWHIV